MKTIISTILYQREGLQWGNLVPIIENVVNEWELLHNMDYR